MEQRVICIQQAPLGSLLTIIVQSDRTFRKHRNTQICDYTGMGEMNNFLQRPFKSFWFASAL